MVVGVVSLYLCYMWMTDIAVWFGSLGGGEGEGEEGGRRGGETGFEKEKAA